MKKPPHESQRTDEARASLVITGTGVVPSKVSSIVGIEPSRAWAKGDEIVHHGAAARLHLPPQETFTGLWCIEFVGTSMEEAISALLRSTEARAEVLRKAAQESGASLSVGLWWDPAPHYGGFSIPAESLRRLTTLCDQITFYFPG